MQSKILILLAALILFSNASKAQNKEDDILGYWLTTGEEPAKIQIYKSGEKFYGKIGWLKISTDNGKPKVDNDNLDKAKETRAWADMSSTVIFSKPSSSK